MYMADERKKRWVERIYIWNRWGGYFAERLASCVSNSYIRCRWLVTSCCKIRMWSTDFRKMAPLLGLLLLLPFIFTLASSSSMVSGNMVPNSWIRSLMFSLLRRSTRMFKCLLVWWRCVVSNYTHIPALCDSLLRRFFSDISCWLLNIVQ